VHQLVILICASIGHNQQCILCFCWSYPTVHQLIILINWSYSTAHLMLLLVILNCASTGHTQLHISCCCWSYSTVCKLCPECSCYPHNNERVPFYLHHKQRSSVCALGLHTTSTKRQRKHHTRKAHATTHIHIIIKHMHMRLHECSWHHRLTHYSCMDIYLIHGHMDIYLQAVFLYRLPLPLQLFQTLLILICRAVCVCLWVSMRSCACM